MYKYRSRLPVPAVFCRVYIMLFSTILSQCVSEALDNRDKIVLVNINQFYQFFKLRKLKRLSKQLWVHSRNNFVNYRGFVSSSSCLASGAPQDSDFGPLLFLLFIIDLRKYYTTEHSYLLMIWSFCRVESAADCFCCRIVSDNALLFRKLKHFG